MDGDLQCDRWQIGRMIGTQFHNKQDVCGELTSYKSAFHPLRFTGLSLD